MATELDGRVDGGPTAPEGPSRRVARRRRGLPAGRAVVGGFLVALAVIGVFGAYLTATAVPGTSYAVAADELIAGQILEASDVAMVAMDLPETVRARSLVDADALVGATVLAPLRPGELIQQSDVVRSGAAPGAREISFAIDASRALGDRILPGERIDLLATYGTGADAVTVLVVADALVLRSTGGAGGLVGDERVEFTLALSEARDALAVAHAVDTAEITVARTTLADESVGPRRYTPEDVDVVAPAPDEEE